MSDNIRICKGPSHHLTTSIYDYDKVPIELFVNAKQKSFFMQCIDCRDYKKVINDRYNQKNKDFISKEGTQQCTSTYHNKSGSGHPKESVPIKLFKNLEKSDIIYKSCQYCRDYLYINNVTRKTKKKELVKQQLKDNSEFILCIHKFHNVENVSIYPRERVPKKLFLKDSEDLDGDVYDTCQDCRTYRNNNAEDKHERIQRIQKLKTYNKLLKQERIDQYQSCCYNCNCLFFYNEQNNSVDVIEPVFINNERHFMIDNIVYSSKEAIELYKNKIEYVVLEFDHLTEIEQRERGMLLPDQPYIAKVDDVSQMMGKESMRLESLKCQLVCSRCHLIDTSKRQKGRNLETLPLLERKRVKHILPIKLKGCVNCGYINTDIPKFFEFDHLDPSNKISGICEMTQLYKYTYDEFVAEVAKCQVLCRFCHSLHTRSQRNNS